MATMAQSGDSGCDPPFRMFAIPDGFGYRFMALLVPAAFWVDWVVGAPDAPVFTGASTSIVSMDGVVVPAWFGAAGTEGLGALGFITASSFNVADFFFELELAALADVDALASLDSDDFVELALLALGFLLLDVVVFCLSLIVSNE